MENNEKATFNINMPYNYYIIFDVDREELSAANAQTKERTSLDMLTDNKKEKQDQLDRMYV